ncbi:ATP-binding protein [Corynebacterium cystitidis]|uniref:ATP-binding protein n=1 Tax=Corynebacterium cystitidis TaxID=35757 RepID=UPI00211E39C6|nr:ATP-binding protein [Corynebacterium cystitidis]
MKSGYVYRQCEKVVEESVEYNPVTLIRGARQVGKSTLSQVVGRRHDALFYTLDDADVRALVAADPKGFLGQARDRLVVIDEVQRSPELILAIKSAVDADRRPGMFLLTGSADLSQLRGVGDSLAGRVEAVQLFPFSVGERRGVEREDFVTRFLRGELAPVQASLDAVDVICGGYPNVYALPQRRREAWVGSYLDALAGRDAREIGTRAFPVQFESLVRWFAAAGHAEVNISRLARDLDSNRTSMAQYVDTLRMMFLVGELPAFSRNILGRETKQKKIGIVDTGLASAVTGFSEDMVFQPGGREYWGGLVEQFVVSELRKQQQWSETTFRMFHYRSQFGEVDVVLELRDGRLILVEVKAGQTFRAEWLKHLRSVGDAVGDRLAGSIILHGGSTIAKADGVDILPINALWS